VLAEPENAQPAVTDLPHINPTFVNQVSVEQIDPSAPNGSAESGGTVKSTETSNTLQLTPKRGYGPSCAPHSAPISFSPNTQNSYHFILVEVSL
jgi:hypothetical protein